MTTQFASESQVAGAVPLPVVADAVDHVETAYSDGALAEVTADAAAAEAGTGAADEVIDQLPAADDAGVAVSEERVQSEGAPAVDPAPTAAVTEAPAADQPGFELPVHQVCGMFALMAEEELVELAEDIRTHGLVKPIVTHEGQIVDGRNRLLACHKAGVEPRYVEWAEVYTGSMSLAHWIWSMNAERRHLTPDQRASAAAKLHLWEATQDAQGRQLEGRQRGGQTAGKSRPKPDSLPMISSGSYEAPVETAGPSGDPQPDHPERARSGDVRARMAKETGVSQYKMQQAINVERVAPALGDRVVAGEMSLAEATKQIVPKVPKRKRAAPASTESAASTNQAATSAAKAPDSAPKRAKRGALRPEIQFDMEPALTKATHAVEAALDSVPDEYRDAFLDEMAKMLENMR